MSRGFNYYEHKKIAGKISYWGLNAIIALAILITPFTIHSDFAEKSLPMTALNTLTKDSNAWQIKEAIGEVAINKERAEIMLKIAECESGYKDVCIVDTNGKLSCGIFMFQESTLKYFCPDLKWGKGEIKDNIVCAARVMSGSISVIKKHWVNCSKKIFK